MSLDEVASHPSELVGGDDIAGHSLPALVASPSGSWCVCSLLGSAAAYAPSPDTAIGAAVVAVRAPCCACTVPFGVAATGAGA